uniref:Uncharacterized protein n=1 Tax=Chromera velia CCMP2878 TaxID=1169474 RepID=A0A0G4I2U4_9ALVE|eukprot:Cvel_10459.t1-p1 / transcript=Cvel_10459.t1 / gene=Cvel_10459 / organism=Chromera_velia_CCMP2878 / gene_product=hypothetical protein / transcript_product=hypothetical protein / location=Cvel_scaffold630:19029-20294(+) / protein_length=422 / sequence_SO=supercontig / SO=protein_coding / is_pseudo=false
MQPTESGVNFRTCGNAPLKYSKLQRGATCRSTAAALSVCSRISPSSIPSRMETLLFPGPREKDGFGSRSLRFSEDSEKAEAPGPAAYRPYRANSLCPDSSSDSSLAFNQKGYTSIISSSSRFGPGGPFSGPKSTNGPGPCSYELSPLSKKSDFKTGNSSSFISRANWSCNIPATSKFFPGPGEYSKFPNSKTSHQNPAGVSLRSCSPRIDSVKEQIASPAPGSYDASVAVGSRLEPSTGKDPSPVFRPPCGRVVRSVNTRDFPVVGLFRSLETGDLKKAKDMREKGSEAAGAKGCFLQALGSDERKPPGPSDYNVRHTKDPIGACRGPSHSLHGSSMFLSQSPRKGMRKAGAQTHIPGPGDYDASGFRDGLTSNWQRGGATLRSASQRWLSHGHQTPGPAFYRVESPRAKRSYHLNMEERWV